MTVDLESALRLAEGSRKVGWARAYAAEARLDESVVNLRAWRRRLWELLLLQVWRDPEMFVKHARTMGELVWDGEAWDDLVSAALWVARCDPAKHLEGMQAFIDAVEVRPK